MSEPSSKKWDVFVSYASEDKADVARPLAHLLDRAGLRVWFDEFALRIGDRLSETIARGLATSRYGVVVVSPAFMAKKWPLNELAGPFALEGSERGLILPVWHKVSAGDVKEFNAILADRHAVDTRDGIERVAEAISWEVGSWRAADLRGSVEGRWRGESGRLLLRVEGEAFLGDYDWYGEKWAGSISGSVVRNVLWFDWSWSIDSRTGHGFFFDRARRTRGGYHRCLTGAWWYADAPVDKSEVLQLFDGQLHEGWLSERFGYVAEREHLDVYPWSFVTESWTSHWPSQF
jgi:hypothetical protein